MWEIQMGSFIDQEEEIPPRFRSSPTKYGGGRQEKWCMVGQRDFFLLGPIVFMRDGGICVHRMGFSFIREEKKIQPQDGASQLHGISWLSIC